MSVVLLAMKMTVVLLSPFTSILPKPLMVAAAEAVAAEAAAVIINFFIILNRTQ